MPPHYNMTKYGVVYDLEKSHYSFRIDNITYYFSSLIHLSKFTKGYYENRHKVNETVSNRYGMTIELNLIADIHFYSKIETRGFYIMYGKEVYTCKKAITLSGVNPMPIH